MSKIIAISNHKGGVGKTTSVINIGAGLNRLGKTVLLIDLDAQANLSQSLGITEPLKTIYGALRGIYPLDKCFLVQLRGGKQTGIKVIPSNLDLAGAEIELISETRREFVLKDLIEPYKNNYDFILIDCPPSLGLLTINALTVADEVFIPINAQNLTFQSFAKLTEVIRLIQKKHNKELLIGGIIITQYNDRKILNKDDVEALKSFFGDKVFNTKIRDDVALAEAPNSKRYKFQYKPNSIGAEDYLDLCIEILNKYKLI